MSKMMRISGKTNEGIAKGVSVDDRGYVNTNPKSIKVVAKKTNIVLEPLGVLEVIPEDKVLYFDSIAGSIRTNSDYPVWELEVVAYFSDGSTVTTDSGSVELEGISGRGSFRNIVAKGSHLNSIALTNKSATHTATITTFEIINITSTGGNTLSAKNNLGQNVPLTAELDSNGLGVLRTVQSGVVGYNKDKDTYKVELVEERNTDKRYEKLFFNKSNPSVAGSGFSVRRGNEGVFETPIVSDFEIRDTTPRWFRIPIKDKFNGASIGLKVGAVFDAEMTITIVADPPFLPSFNANPKLLQTKVKTSTSVLTQFGDFGVPEIETEDGFLSNGDIRHVNLNGVGEIYVGIELSQPSSTGDIDLVINRWK